MAGRISARNLPCSYPRGTVPASLAELVPEFVTRAIMDALPKLDHLWRGRFIRDGIFVGPEARGSSPIRIVREATRRESPSVSGLYPTGEGAGYAGGIVSAAVDGLRTANTIISRYAPRNR